MHPRSLRGNGWGCQLRSVGDRHGFTGTSSRRSSHGAVSALGPGDAGAAAVRGPPSDGTRGQLGLGAPRAPW